MEENRKDLDHDSDTDTKAKSMISMARIWSRNLVEFQPFCEFPTSDAKDEITPRINKICQLLIDNESIKRKTKSIINPITATEHGGELVVSTLHPHIPTVQMSETGIVAKQINNEVKLEHCKWLVQKVDGRAKEDGSSEVHWMIKYLTDIERGWGEQFNGAIDIPRHVLEQGTNAIVSTAYNTSRLSKKQTQVIALFMKWAKMLELAELRKTEILLRRNKYYKELKTESPYFDEDSITGLRPLRLSFTKPYLKTANGMIVAPRHTVLEKFNFEDTLVDILNLKKQKWTAKDLVVLREAIRETLIEIELGRINKKYMILLHDCLDAKRIEDAKRIIEDHQKTGNDTEEATKSTNPSDLSRRSGTGTIRTGRFGGIPVFATIAPALFALDDGITVRHEMTNTDLVLWRNKKEDATRKLSYVDALSKEGIDVINWQAVATKVSTKTRKCRLPKACYLAFKYEADPEVNNRKIWTKAEVEAQAVEKFGVSEMEKVAEHLQTNRTEFRYFQKWKTTFGKVPRIEWNEQMDCDLVELIYEHDAAWKKIEFAFNNDLASKNKLKERFKKKANPVLVKGKFSRVEDTLLLLTIEKLRPQINRDGHFGELTSYLPWRFETVWRDRASNLFGNFIVPWTVEEDKQLLVYAKTMNRDWRRISETFNSFKNRKGCLTRHKILTKRLEQYGTVEEYHVKYSMTRYNVQQYRHLNLILAFLKKIEPLPQAQFEKLSLAKTPTEHNLAKFLLSFDRKIMRKTIKFLANYIKERDEYWKVYLEKVKDKQKTFDRRTFHRGNPQSMASALHIRDVKLKPRKELNFTLDQFQEEVYKHYARFSKTKSLNRNAKRPYIPEAMELCEMEEVKDILMPYDPQKEKASTSTRKRTAGGKGSRGKRRRKEVEVIELSDDD